MGTVAGGASRGVGLHVVGADGRGSRAGAAGAEGRHLPGRCRFRRAAGGARLHCPHRGALDDLRGARGAHRQGRQAHAAARAAHPIQRYPRSVSRDAGQDGDGGVRAWRLDDHHECPGIAERRPWGCREPSQPGQWGDHQGNGCVQRQHPVGRAMMRPILLAALGCLLGWQAQAATRIKDIISVQGVRANQLVGYGLVIGLNGTGDTLRNSPFTQQSLQSMLDRMGINVRNANARTRNVAAVIVTADLPAFAGKGARIDITVSSLGDATSLAGGSLILTPLIGADNQIYAVGQGPLAVAGFASGGKAETLTQGVPTTGRIPNGALVEREAPGRLTDEKALVLELRNPDFNTAVNVADAINAHTVTRYGVKVARENDLRTITVNRPFFINSTRLLADIGELAVETDVPARVVIDERTGTIVIGKDVQISTVAVAHGNLTVRVTESARVSQPLPFSKGETTVAPETTIIADQKGGNFAIVRGTNLQTLVAGLNRIGLKPNGIIAILQAIKSAGALQADLVVQ